MSLVKGTVRPLLKIISPFFSRYLSLNLDFSLENPLSVINAHLIVTWTLGTLLRTIASIQMKCMNKSLYLAQTGWTGCVFLLFSEKSGEKRTEGFCSAHELSQVLNTSQSVFYFLVSINYSTQLGQLFLFERFIQTS